MLPRRFASMQPSKSAPPPPSPLKVSGGAADLSNRGLEKSIGAYDVTHDFKMSGSYELPFGKGQRHLNSGPGDWVLGNCHVAGIAIYDSGQPVGISTNLSLP